MGSSPRPWAPEPVGSPATLDYSKMEIPDAWFEAMEPAMQRAFAAMAKLEGGAIANPDENRMVGHYWLRDFSLIPNADLRAEVIRDDASMRAFVDTPMWHRANAIRSWECYLGGDADRNNVSPYASPAIAEDVSGLPPAYITAMEFDLLQVFAQNPDRVLSRDRLLDLAHHKDDAPFDRSIDIRIARLRRKIEADPSKPQVLKTVRGGGYMFVPTKP